MNASPISLRRLTREETRELANARIPDDRSALAEPGALPPSFVAERSLELLAGGQPECWCLTFLIVRNADQRVIGGCGFKGEPRDGRVEIGYGVAPKSRGQGAATAAVQGLLDLAFAEGAREVVATIGVDNAASTRVALKLLQSRAP